MFSPISSDISQNNTKILKKQQQEMQRLLEQLEEAAKLRWAEHTA